MWLHTNILDLKHLFLSTNDAHKESSTLNEATKVIKIKKGCIDPTNYHIASHVFSTMSVSKLFENVELSPVFKKDDHMNKMYFRPVSILVCLKNPEKLWPIAGFLQQGFV